MSTSFESSLPSDIRLLLRADAEQCWLHREVLPVLHEVESHEHAAEEEVGAALAYLEAMWDEAKLRARETDAAHRRLGSVERECAALEGPAGRYHAAVRALRGIVAERVRPLIGRALDHRETQAKQHEVGVRASNARPGGCAPHAT